MGEHELALALNTTESKHDAPPQGLLWAEGNVVESACAQQGETLLGLGSAGVPRKPSSGLSMATPGDPLSYLSSATCGHWETFVCAVCSKGGMVLVGTAQL